MFRLRLFVVLLSALFLVGFAAAQEAAPANLPARAVVAYANLMTPEVVAELQPSYPEVDDLAFAVVNYYLESCLLAPALAAEIKLALTSGVLPHGPFVTYLADVYNGCDPAPESVAMAMAQLAEAGVNVPVADESGNVTDVALTDALTTPMDGVLTSDNSYDDAITPIVPTANR